MKRYFASILFAAGLMAAIPCAAHNIGELQSGQLSPSQLTIPSGSNPGVLSCTPARGGTCGGTYRYIWQVRHDVGDWSGVDSSGALKYSPGTLTSNTYFRVMTICGTDTVYTSPASILIGTPITNWNYIRTRNIARPGIADTTAASALTDPHDVQQVTQFLDGLGRPIQTVARQASPLQKDMVTLMDYDAFGRPSINYLPYTASSATDGEYKSGSVQAAYGFNSTMFPDEQYAFGTVQYEPSPMARPLNTYSPGNSWVGSSRGISNQYLTNLAADSVHWWNIGYNPGSLAADSGYYAPGTLVKTVAIDEQGHQVVEYKDKDGQVVLKKVQLADNTGIAHAGWLSTYYVYDDLRNLRFVIPPKAVELVNTGAHWTMTSAIANGLCFRYEYDGRRRMTVKKIPGAGEVDMIYDIRDRLVMSQDANLRAASQWLIAQYDSLNRPIETGLITYVATPSVMQQLVTNQTDGTNPLLAPPVDTTVSGGNTTGLIEASYSITMDDGFSTADDGTFTAEIGDGIADNGSSTTSSNTVMLRSVPPGVEVTPLTFTYYDDYSWVPGTGTALSSTFASGIAGNSNYFITSYNTAPAYAVPVTPYSVATGQVTGTQTFVLGTGNQYLYAVNFFDDHGRAIQTQSLNYTGGIDTLTTQYDFSGKPLHTLLGLAKPSNTAQYHRVLTKTNYDAGFRMTSMWKNIDGAPADQLIDSMQYNELGQLRTKFLGRDATTGIPLDSLVYDYNIRGWITGINKDYTSPTPTHHYFGMELGYDKPATTAGKNFSNPAFNGNIAGMVWKSAGDGVDRKYDFTYDNVNRLTGAAYQDNHTGSGWDHLAMDYSVDTLSYDANGNILKMQQRGFMVGKPTDPIDLLTYSYPDASNQLSQVLDAANDTASKLGDFHYKSKSGSNDYVYDGNGNLTRDNNKQIDSIYYNYLNLPQRVHMTGKGNISYIYDAGGNKLAKQTADSAAGMVTTTLYLDGFQFQRRTPLASPGSGVDTLQFTGHEEGRSRWVFHRHLAGDSAYGWEYDFTEKDHLGNTRVLLTQEKDTALYVATMERQYRATENALFYNVDSTAYGANLVPNGGFPAEPNGPTPNDSVSMVDGAGHKMGPAILLKVMSGDSVALGAYSYYASNGSVAPPNNSFTNVMNSLAAGLETLTGGTHGGLSGLTNATNGPIYSAVNSFLPSVDTNTTTIPKAYLNWMLVDNQFNYVSGNNQSGALPVGQAGQLNTLATGVRLNHSGYLYIWVSNETPNWRVFFDNLSVEHFSGPMVEETHYYPYGLTMAGISDKALKSNYAENKYRWNKGSELQNKEFTDGSGLEMYETHLRELDPQLGRWWQVDPEPKDEESPYASMGNNPIRFEDPMGNDTLPSGRYIWDPGAREELQEMVNENPDATWTPNFWERLYLIGENVGLFALPEGKLATAAEATTKEAKVTTEVKVPEVKAPEVKPPEVKAPDAKPAEVKVDKPYQRPANATTKEQRASVQNKPCTDCGATAKKMVADHKKPLVQEYYETGKIDKQKMHATSSVQPQCPTCSAKQGAEMSKYSKAKKKENGL